MKSYDYIVHYVYPQITEIKGCDKPIDWDNINVDGFCRFNTPDGTISINMRNVTTIKETIKEV